MNPMILLQRTLVFAAAALLASGAFAQETASYKLTARDGVFEPTTIEVPAGKRFRIEIVNEGKSLRVRVGGETDAQCLFAVEREGKDSRPVGVVLYVRDSFERITVLHLVVAEAYAAGGPRAGYNLALRLVQAVKRVARRTSGIRHVELLYSQERLRAAFA